MSAVRVWAARAIILSIFLTPLIGFVWLRTMSVRAAEQSALWHARDMILIHLGRTGGEWPRSWKELEDDFEAADADYRSRSFKAVRDRVEINFTLDPQQLVDDPPGRPRLLWLKDRPQSQIVADTNEGLLETLQQRSGAKVTDEEIR
jgi:hypothetical protein